MTLLAGAGIGLAVGFLGSTTARASSEPSTSSPPMSIGGSRRWSWRSTVTVLVPRTQSFGSRHFRFVRDRWFPSPRAVRDRPRRHGDPRCRMVERGSHARRFRCHRNGQGRLGRSATGTISIGDGCSRRPGRSDRVRDRRRASRSRRLSLPHRAAMSAPRFATASSHGHHGGASLL